MLGESAFELRRVASASIEDYAGGDKKDERSAQADAEVGAVGDGADDLGREGVAEEMNAEEVDGDGGGANRRRDRIDDSCIERAGVEEEEEFGGKERGYSPGMRAEEEQYAARQGERDAPE